MSFSIKSPDLIVIYWFLLCRLLASLFLSQLSSVRQQHAHFFFLLFDSIISFSFSFWFQRIRFSHRIEIVQIFPPLNSSENDDGIPSNDGVARYVAYACHSLTQNGQRNEFMCATNAQRRSKRPKQSTTDAFVLCEYTFPFLFQGDFSSRHAWTCVRLNDISYNFLIRTQRWKWILQSAAQNRMPS